MEEEKSMIDFFVSRLNPHDQASWEMVQPVSNKIALLLLIISLSTAESSELIRKLQVTPGARYVPDGATKFSPTTLDNPPPSPISALHIDLHLRLFPFG